MGRTEQLLKLWKDAFGAWDGFWEVFLRCAFSWDRCVTLEEDGRIQAALCWFDCGSWAYIYAVVTAPDCRGRGLCRRLIAKAHAQLETLGFQGALLVPAEEGLRRMYAGMGYREATTLHRFSCKAGDKAVPLHTLTPEQYARDRRTWLPMGSVIQEGAALDLMAETGVRFFRGQDCLLAAETGEPARVLEYLGDVRQAPGVLKTLGCRAGTFRTPGGKTPFAMAIPFRENIALPEYFAFELD